MHFPTHLQDGFDSEPETLRAPNIPVPKNSEVRIKVTRSAAIVDIVTADLQLDPRSEEYIGDASMITFPKPRYCMIPAPARSLPSKARVDLSQLSQHAAPETMRSPESLQKPISKAQARRERAAKKAITVNPRKRAS